MWCEKQESDFCDAEFRGGRVTIQNSRHQARLFSEEFIKDYKG